MRSVLRASNLLKLENTLKWGFIIAECLRKPSSNLKSHYRWPSLQQSMAVHNQIYNIYFVFLSAPDMLSLYHRTISFLNNIIDKQKTSLTAAYTTEAYQHITRDMERLMENVYSIDLPASDNKLLKPRIFVSINTIDIQFDSSTITMVKCKGWRPLASLQNVVSRFNSYSNSQTQIAASFLFLPANDNLILSLIRFIIFILCQSWYALQRMLIKIKWSNNIGQTYLHVILSSP